MAFFGKIMGILLLLVGPNLALAQDETATAESDETLYEGPLYGEMTLEDAEALSVGFERRILIPPLMGQEGTFFTFGMNYKSSPMVEGSEMANAVAGLTPIIPSFDLGFDWVTERQRIFIHGFYLPYIDLAASPVDFGQYWTAFGQDLLLANVGKPGRGLIFSYRFGYSATEMTRQFSVEDTSNLAFFDSTSFTSEVNLGWRLSDFDLLMYGIAGSVNNTSSEFDYYNDNVIDLKTSNTYFGGGLNVCFRNETLCMHFEGHVDVESNFTYGGSFYIRK